MLALRHCQPRCLECSAVGIGPESSVAVNARHRAVDSVELLTVAPTASTPLLFRVRATAVGTVPLGASGFDLRLIVNRVDGTDVLTNGIVEDIIAFWLASGAPTSGTWTGTAVVTLRPQSAGQHSFAAVADATGTFDFSGSWSSAVTDSVIVAP